MGPLWSGQPRWAIDAVVWSLHVPQHLEVGQRVVHDALVLRILYAELLVRDVVFIVHARRARLRAEVALPDKIGDRSPRHRELFARAPVDRQMREDRVRAPQTLPPRLHLVY